MKGFVWGRENVRRYACPFFFQFQIFVVWSIVETSDMKFRVRAAGAREGRGLYRREVYVG